MAKFELAIRAYDQEDLPSGHKRSKQGDVIACNPYPHDWGDLERKHFLIVIVDGLTARQSCALCSSCYDEDKVDEEVDIENPPQKVAKRRFKLPVDILASISEITINYVLLEDENVDYQPLKDADYAFDFSTDEMLYDKYVDGLSKTKINSLE